MRHAVDEEAVLLLGERVRELGARGSLSSNA